MRRRRAGFTLTEVMVALGILGMGATFTSQMVRVNHDATRSAGAGTEAITLASRLIAEIQNAPLVLGREDPGLVGPGQVPVSNGQGEISAPIPGSTIRTVGLFDAQSSTSGNGVTAYEVRYEVRDCAVCAAPFGAAGGLAGVDVLVSVYPAGGQVGLERPLRILVRRHYAARSRETLPRGL